MSLSDDVELFLQLDGSGCAYYFVDHVTRTEFWMDPLDTEYLNIPPIISASHLSQCSALFWSCLVIESNSRAGFGRIILVSFGAFPDAS